MACGGFACSKNCLCALNLLYTVRARPARRRGLCLVPLLPPLPGLGWAGEVARRGSPAGCAAGVGAPRRGRRAVAASGSGGRAGRGGEVTAVRPSFVAARTWLLGIKIQGGPGALPAGAAAGSPPARSGLGPPVPFFFVWKGRCTNSGVKQGKVCFVIAQPSISAHISAVRSVTRPPAPPVFLGWTRELLSRAAWGGRKIHEQRGKKAGC